MSWKKCINQLDSYLFEKTIENLLIRQYVGILFHMGMNASLFWHFLNEHFNWYTGEY